MWEDTEVKPLLSYRCRCDVLSFILSCGGSPHPVRSVLDRSLRSVTSVVGKDPVQRVGNTYKGFLKVKEGKRSRRETPPRLWVSTPLTRVRQGTQDQGK